MAATSFAATIWDMSLSGSEARDLRLGPSDSGERGGRGAGRGYPDTFDFQRVNHPILGLFPISFWDLNILNHSFLVFLPLSSIFPGFWHLEICLWISSWQLPFYCKMSVLWYRGHQQANSIWSMIGKHQVQITGWDTLTIIDPMDFIPMTLLLFFSFLGDGKKVKSSLCKSSNVKHGLMDVGCRWGQLEARGVGHLHLDAVMGWLGRSMAVPCSDWGVLDLTMDTRPGKHTKNHGKSPFLMGKSTIDCHFQ